MNWLDTLRNACAATSQRETARRIGVNQAVLSLLLAGKYTADPTWIAAAVEQHLGNQVDWLSALRAECERTNQVRAAQRLGVSTATVSQVLSGQYKADPRRIARRVRGALLGETVECPVALEMPLHKCQEIQDRKAGAGGNPVYARAWLCCKGQGEFADAGPCPHACSPAQPAAANTATQETTA